MEQTFALLKPDTVQHHALGRVLTLIEADGFHVVKMRMLQLTPVLATTFYAEHRDRPFFAALVALMVSGPIVALVLERDDAIAGFRRLMGATDSTKAEPGTIRAAHGGAPIWVNAVHGSDGAAAVARESAMFFPT